MNLRLALITGHMFANGRSRRGGSLVTFFEWIDQSREWSPREAVRHRQAKRGCKPRSGKFESKARQSV